MKQATAICARILVIDDNRSDVFLLERALNRQDLQFDLVHLSTGSQALEFLRGEGPYSDAVIASLILLDLNLSRYTGEDILREIRNTPHFADVPVCVWSSSRSRHDAAMLESFGVLQFITKPAGLDQFMEIGKTIKELLIRAHTA